MSKNDYLAFRDNFIAHAAPRKSSAGMPSEIWNAGKSGMKKKADDNTLKYSSVLQRVKKFYSNILVIANQYHSGKINFDTAKSLTYGNIESANAYLDKLPDSGIYYYDNPKSYDSYVASTSTDADLMRKMGFSDAEARSVKSFIEELSRGGGRSSQGSRAGMPSNIKHAGLNDYKNEYVSHATRAGMPTNVPSMYRGKSNVSSNYVYDSAKYKAYQEFKEKYTKYSIELQKKKQDLYKAKEAKKLVDQIPTLEKEIPKLENLVARYKQYTENTSQSQAKSAVDKARNTEKNVNEVLRFASKSFVSGNGNIVKGMATTLVEENTPIKGTSGFSFAKKHQGDKVSEFYFGKRKARNRY